jgi:hypothetical protein
LATLRAKEAVPKLRPLLKRDFDPALQEETIRTLESLTGKSLKKGAPLAERARAWDTALGTN